MSALGGDPNGAHAKVIADSVNPNGQRLMTVEATFHRFVLAEVNTHRSLAKNSASSRAIPFTKMLARVLDNPAIPLSFPAEQKGMQGGAEVAHAAAEAAWLKARDAAVVHARNLAEQGVHKSVANRLLEPFAWHTAIITGVEDTSGWLNFFAQRCSPLAQPEIRRAAECIRDAMAASEPRPLGYGEWHTPYAGDEFPVVAQRLRISAARSARVSYLTHDGRIDAAEDLALFARLREADPPHWSPMEHQARPRASHEEPRGCLAGWRQFRHDLEDVPTAR